MLRKSAIYLFLQLFYCFSNNYCLFLFCELTSVDIEKERQKKKTRQDRVETHFTFYNVVVLNSREG